MRNTRSPRHCAPRPVTARPVPSVRAVSSHRAPAEPGRPPSAVAMSSAAPRSFESFVRQTQREYRAADEKLVSVVLGGPPVRAPAQLNAAGELAHEFLRRRLALTQAANPGVAFERVVDHVADAFREPMKVVLLQTRRPVSTARQAQLLTLPTPAPALPPSARDDCLAIR